VTYSSAVPVPSNAKQTIGKLDPYDTPAILAIQVVSGVAFVARSCWLGTSRLCCGPRSKDVHSHAGAAAGPRAAAVDEEVPRLGSVVVHPPGGTRGDQTDLRQPLLAPGAPQ